MRRPRAPGSPEGTRANTPSHRRLRTGSLGVIVLLCASFAIAIGEDTPSLTVRNLTSHVVTIVVADKTYSTVAAGDAVTYASNDSATVVVNVSYAPGQGVDGSARRSFQLQHHNPKASASYFACYFEGGLTSPAPGWPVLWDVTADTLASR